MKGSQVAALASLLPPGAVPAGADPHGAAHVESMFRSADANRDGAIAIAIAESDDTIEAEFRRHARQARLWRHADVRKRPLDAGAAQLVPDMQASVITRVLAGYDGDGDRRITLANHRQVQTALLLRVGADKDGRATSREARPGRGLGGP